ncbi:translation initiation factor IF-2 [Cellvibrio japonicus]|uniref:Translation initiation factor IF-2 n=1 Tax=Cellvibrio japonicus (strain Ueda107) TaxID=498211 RepID=IF2_CELJU|nr:translation initiation factor IF-2 [Cellvibrio japonicus]B3PI96.1 RecName: Full=Translation initiation factor IF-2 [Cellvibrio japonicus Ueda107]ACE84775.1 translation initiation factor IF-2 [Cellvibrio japonicus Ueda107]QEI11138.1 translation initiation factor IF-2 [Cellvibrio japonicus]QEI14712.1 translation initiation factor IF-2 [Cellvibrio japonicus]QEI18292.1 translation initiation factor IF-2 [Cellvibrio japonicus]
MAEVTVNELATSIGAPVERLLKQMQEAGLQHKTASAKVSDEEKQRLLAYLKGSHGEAAVEPRKITLQRKTTTTIKTGTGNAKKTVNVEVRKKRTYVKREDDVVDNTQAAQSQEQDDELASTVVEEVQQAEPSVVPVVDVAPEPEPEPVVEEVDVAAEEAEPVEAAVDTSAPTRFSFTDGIEEKRRAAIERRQAEEAARQAELKAIEEAKRAAEEAKRTQPRAEKPADKSAAAGKGAKPDNRQPAKGKQAPVAVPVEREDAKHGHGHKKHHHGRNDDDFDDDSADRGNKRGAGKAVKKAAAPKKSSKIDLLDFVGDDSEDSDVLARRSHIRAHHKKNNKHAFKKPTTQIVHEIDIPETIAVSELAQRLTIKVGELIKRLMKMGVMASMNEQIDQDTAVLIVEELGHKANLVSENDIEHALEKSLETAGELTTRAPVVTVMGHVDHGKTSLLDYIREAKVAAGEAGGITQHIGAYRVTTSRGEITFLDTPGHAAFTAMRARGAKATDVVILVVAADDGVMPQTEEAIMHARAAEVPIVVAINKCDKPSADPDRVTNELVAKGVIPEAYGGDTQFVQVSAHTGQGIDELLEAISLQAEVLELTAVTNAAAKGVVIEARVDKGRGTVATVLVQQGTLKQGDLILAGQSYGRVRAMVNERGEQVKEAGPSTPVEILGLDMPPSAGDDFVVLDDERKAREVAAFRAEKERKEKLARFQAAKLENMFSNMEAGQKKTLTVVIKADVRGSLEAIQASLADIGNDEVQVNVISSGIGGITENDVNLAVTSGAIIVGFNVRADGATRRLAETEGVDIRYYSIIYQLLDEVKAALSGMLDPERVETIVGIANVREVFNSPKFGQVAGCMVVEGTVYRNKPIRVLRDNVVIFTGELESLRRFKDDVNEVRNGFECGIGVKNYDVKVGDQIEVYEVKEVARQL